MLSNGAIYKFPRSLFVIDLPTPLIVRVYAFLTIHNRLMWLGGSPERNCAVVAYWRRTHAKQLQQLVIRNAKIARVFRERHCAAAATEKYRTIRAYFEPHR
jgi:hypothetical protein